MENYITEYMKITQKCFPPDSKYPGPEKQAAAIKKCTILEATAIEYSNQTAPNSSKVL